MRGPSQTAMLTAVAGVVRRAGDGGCRPGVPDLARPAPALHLGFLDAIAALARRGNLVALSAAGHPAGVIEAAFEGVVVVRVGLDCALPTLLEREQGRDGRWSGLSAGSVAVHEGWNYDARFDTGRLSPDAIAGELLRVLDPLG